MKEKNNVVAKAIIVVAITVLMMIAGFITFNIVFIKDANKNIIKSFQKKAETIVSKYPYVGVIHIDKINIEYPILEDSSEEAMKTSVVKLFGANPDEIGNLCIMGNNTKNNLFFSNLVKLESGDEISIKNKENKEVKYAVYDMYTTSLTDSEFLSQKTGDKREVTLVTETTKEDKRIIVKAREI
ncbi:MAG: sortase [Clostridia bacterium]